MHRAGTHLLLLATTFAITLATIVFLVQPVYAGMEFSQCDGDKQRTLAKAFEQGSLLLRAAIVGSNEVRNLATVSDGERQQRLQMPMLGGAKVNRLRLEEAYIQAFGPFDAGRFERISYRLAALHSVTRNKTVTAICDSFSAPSAVCRKGVVAYIDRIPNTLRIIFCQRYFGSPKTDQKLTKLYAHLANVDLYHAGVMLHEFTHLSAWDATITVDKRYDNDRVIKLGKKHPDRAVDNADSYHFFVIRGFFAHE